MTETETRKIIHDNIGFFSADLSIWIFIYIKEHGVTHWREIKKLIDDFEEDWNKDPQKFKEWLAKQTQ